MKPVRYGLLGRTLGHSFSRKYFTDLFEREGIDAQYVNFELEYIGDIIIMLARNPDLLGFNVTIPYKQSVMRYLTGITDSARAIGAVNVVTVRPRPDGNVDLYGDNSDAPAFRETLQALLTAERRRGALVLGTGGASKAVRWALEKENIPYLTVSRTPHSPGEIAYGDIDADLLRRYPTIINATPLGTYPANDTCPPIPYEDLTPDNLCYDLVYNPEITTFMRRAAEHGATVTNGLAMLHRQAQLAWQTWPHP